MMIEFFSNPQSNRDNPAALAFWMANSSEILHFFKQDHDIHPFSQDAQEMLAESVQTAFHHLNRCLQYDLQKTLPAFLDENDEDEMNGKGLGTLQLILNLLKGNQGMEHGKLLKPIDWQPGTGSLNIYEVFF